MDLSETQELLNEKDSELEELAREDIEKLKNKP